MIENKNNICNLISLNVRGLRSKEKRDAIFMWSKHQKADILLLQETYWTDNILKIIRNEWKGQCYFCNGSNHSRGVAILIAKDLPIVIESVVHGQEGRIIMINAKINCLNLCIVNIYAPTEKKYRECFFKRLLGWIQSNRYPHYDLVIGGDFNSILCPKKDVKRITNVYYKTPIHLKNLIKRLGLCDIWRTRNPTKQQFTWRNLYLDVASRLDYWLVNSSIKSKVMVSDIRPAIRCDHNAISLKLLVGKIEKGPGYWKLNTQVLKDDKYKRKIKDIIEKIEKMNLSFCERWELIKIRCREFTQIYCTEKKKKTNELKRILEQRLAIISKELDNKNFIDDVSKREYVRIKCNLEDIYKRECKGASVRSRIRWLEKGERNTKYFMSLEKKNAEKKNIARLRKGTKVITKRADIVNEVVSFYEELYTSKQVQRKDIKSYFEGNSVNRLTEKEKYLCEGLLSNTECRKAAFKMLRNKTPGGDGLPIEFYQEFLNDIEFILVNALNENFSNKIMSKSQRQGVIALIHKKRRTGKFE